MAITVIRYPNFMAEPEILGKLAKELAEKTRFEYFCSDLTAPHITNCVTSIRYLMSKATNVELPSNWLGGMPRALLSRGWTIIRVLPSAIKMGDLIILRKDTTNQPKIDERYLSHILIALNCHEFFHSTSVEKDGPLLIKRGGRIEAFKQWSRVIDEPALFLSYVDWRNVAMRAIINGKDPTEMCTLKKLQGYSFNIVKEIGSNQWLSLAIHMAPDPQNLLPLSAWQLINEYAAEPAFCALIQGG